MEKATRHSHPQARGQSGASGEGGEEPSLSHRLRAIVQRAIPRGALILASLTFVSFGMGLLKTKVLAHTFGAGTETDAFNAAFVLPGLILEVLVVGGLIASFVPLYIGLRDEDQEQARTFARTILTLAVLAMTAAVAIMVVFAPECVAFVAPGFKGDQRSLAIDLFRILAATQIVFAASWVLGEILIAEKMWLSYALAPITYSGGIIAGALLLGGDGQLGIYGAAVGAFGGAVVYLAIRLAGVLRAGFVPAPRLSLRTKGLREYFVLMVPKMVSQPLESSVIVLYFTVLASTLQTGSVTNLTYAREFQTAPELVIGAQFAIAAFPALAGAADLGDRRGFRRIFGTNLATIAVLSTAAAVALLTLGWLGVRILLSGGAYTEQDVATTTMLVGIFAVSIPLESVVELLARAIYATKNTVIPMAASIVSFVALFLTAHTLAPVAGLAAIPAAYAVGMAVKLVILAVALAPRMERIGRPVGEEPLGHGREAVVATAAAGAWLGAGAPTRRRTTRSGGRTPRMVLGAVAVVILVGAGLYTAVQAIQGASFGYEPVTTPWARVRPTAAVTVPVSASPGPSASAQASPSSQGTVTPPSGPTGSPTPPGQFAMDLYQPGDFIGEITNTWCVAAAMQTMMNIMDAGADTSQDTQTKLDALAVGIAENRSGGPLPGGWAGGLQQLGYGNYEVATANRMQSAINTVVKQVRLTNRPAGLVVWKGWHSWVVSGFVASADPATTDSYSVLGLYIEDVWYNRHSTLNNVARGGYSRPPDSLVPYGELSVDFNPWDQAVSYPAYQKRFVVIIPVK